jgi:hypothetical protein
VKALPLDDVTELPKGPIRLVKLEAEGAEPEILDGMDETLKRVEFVAADMGPERGLEKANTVIDVSDRLFEKNFRLIAFNASRCTGLYKQTFKP